MKRLRHVEVERQVMPSVTRMVAGISCQQMPPERVRQGPRANFRAGYFAKHTQASMPTPLRLQVHCPPPWCWHTLCGSCPRGPPPSRAWTFWTKAARARRPPPPPAAAKAVQRGLARPDLLLMTAKMLTDASRLWMTTITPASIPQRTVTTTMRKVMMTKGQSASGPWGPWRTAMTSKQEQGRGQGQGWGQVQEVRMLAAGPQASRPSRGAARCRRRCSCGRWRRRSGTRTTSRESSARWAAWRWGGLAGAGLWELAWGGGGGMQ